MTTYAARPSRPSQTQPPVSPRLISSLPWQQPYVLVMCAMEEEASFMRDRMNDCSEVPLTGAMRRTRGSIGGMAVDLVVSGIGLERQNVRKQIRLAG